MKIERLVIGTSNAAKLSEWSRLLSPIVEVVGLETFGHRPTIQERGLTFEENARIKAGGYAVGLGEYVFSEDGGYEVDALGGEPGVKSRRILDGDREGTDQELIAYVLQRLVGVPFEQRGVKLTVAVAIADPEGEIVYSDRGSFNGVVAEKPGPVLIEGYPFRSIHFIPELGKTYAELTEEEHDIYSHKRPLAARIIVFLLGLRINDFRVRIGLD